MRVADLTGAMLDYYVARAEGVPAVELEIRDLQREDNLTRGPICVRIMPPPHDLLIGPDEQALSYSTNWALSGPLLEKHRIDLFGVTEPVSYQAEILCPPRVEGEVYYWTYVEGDTALIAICRAVVRAAFGDEVEDLP